jgi:hypothetical protein
MSEDIREALSKAYDEHVEKEEPEEKPEETPEEKPEEKPEEEKVEAKVEEEKPEEEKPEEEKPEEKASDEKPEETSEEEVEEEPKPSKFKAPQSWRPEIRAHWSKLPAEVQAEVSKREVEISRALTNSSNARKLAGQFYQVMQPYAGLIQMQNSTPMATVQNMMQTAALLQMGTPQQKAKAISDVISKFGVDIETLDKILSGEKVDDQAGLIDQRIQRHMAPVNQFLEQQTTQQRAQKQREEQTAATEMETFSNDPKNEFFEDLREDMADLMDVAEAHGRTLTLDTAYRMALESRPEIKKLTKGEAPTSIKRKQIEKAKKAASSVSSSSSPGIKTAPASSIRGALEEAWDKHA